MHHTMTWPFLLLAVSCSAATPKLETYRVDTSTISVSGLSSGGYFAVQFHIAFSGTINGAGIIAGGPFYCAHGDVETALHACMVSPDLISVTALVDITDATAATGTIDDPKYLADDKVYLFSGTLDSIVVPGVMQKLSEYYSAFLAGSGASLMEEFNIPAEHSMVTDDFGNSCDDFASPYINNCSYATAYHILQHIYGNIAPATTNDTIPQNMLEYDQSEFFLDVPEAISMDSIGYVYVPTACKNKTRVCNLHIAFHGCLQGREYVGNEYALNAGYVQVAEKNNIIVLFPQVTNKIPDGTNPDGCWDWWGYTGEDYSCKLGDQMIAVKKMLDRVAGIMA
eukprot:Em0020g205a